MIVPQRVGDLDVDSPRREEVEAPAAVHGLRRLLDVTSRLQPLMDRFDLFLVLLKEPDVEVSGILMLRSATEVAQGEPEPGFIKQNKQRVP